MATSTTTPRTTSPRGGVKSTPKKAKAKPARKAPAKAKASTTKAKATRNGYDDSVKAIATRARKLATPKTEQGPVAKQVADVQRVLTEGPAKAIESVGLTRKQLTAIANGKADRKQVRQLQPLAARVIAAGGAKQWVSGRPLGATLLAWLEQS